MKIKLKQILEAVEPLKILLNKELPIKASYRLGKLKSAIESELNQFEIERQKLVKKYGKEELTEVRGEMKGIKSNYLVRFDETKR